MKPGFWHQLWCALGRQPVQQSREVTSQEFFDFVWCELATAETTDDQLRMLDRFEIRVKGDDQ